MGARVTSSDRRLAWTIAGVLVGAAVLVIAQLWLLVAVLPDRPLWDLEVYRGAVSTWTSGGDLYSYALAHPGRPEGFPFTYPPFAAMVLTPLAFLPIVVVDQLWTLLSFLLIIAMAAIVVLRAPRDASTWLGATPTRARLLGFTAAATIVLLLSMPASHNLVLGQVSFIITALVLVDVGGVLPQRYRGVLVGIAAALKLTPLIVVPYFLVTRQWRAAIVSTGTFLAASMLAFVISPSTSMTYWTDALLDTTRVGELATVQNKSIAGLLSRWDVTSSSTDVLGLVIVAIVVVVALLQARRQYLAGRLIGAALVMGCASVAASPISWPHHQAWIVLAAIWLLLDRRAWTMACGAVLVLLFCALSPLIGQEVMPQGVTDPLLLRLGRDLPTLAIAAVCVLGLPLGVRSRLLSTRGSMEPIPTAKD